MIPTPPQLSFVLPGPTLFPSPHSYALLLHQANLLSPILSDPLLLLAFLPLHNSLLSGGKEGRKGGRKEGKKERRASNSHLSSLSPLVIIQTPQLSHLLFTLLLNFYSIGSTHVIRVNTQWPFQGFLRTPRLAFGPAPSSYCSSWFQLLHLCSTFITPKTHSPISIPSHLETETSLPCVFASTA